MYRGALKFTGNNIDFVNPDALSVEGIKEMMLKNILKSLIMIQIYLNINIWEIMLKLWLIL